MPGLLGRSFKNVLMRGVSRLPQNIRPFVSPLLNVNSQLGHQVGNYNIGNIRNFSTGNFNKKSSPPVYFDSNSKAAQQYVNLPSNPEPPPSLQWQLNTKMPSNPYPSLYSNLLKKNYKIDKTETTNTDKGLKVYAASMYRIDNASEAPKQEDIFSTLPAGLFNIEKGHLASEAYQITNDNQTVTRFFLAPFTSRHLEDDVFREYRGKEYTESDKFAKNDSEIIGTRAADEYIGDDLQKLNEYRKSADISANIFVNSFYKPCHFSFLSDTISRKDMEKYEVKEEHIKNRNSFPPSPNNRPGTGYYPTNRNSFRSSPNNRPGIGCHYILPKKAEEIAKKHKLNQCNIIVHDLKTNNISEYMYPLKNLRDS